MRSASLRARPVATFSLAMYRCGFTVIQIVQKGLGRLNCFVFSPDWDPGRASNEILMDMERLYPKIRQKLHPTYVLRLCLY